MLKLRSTAKSIFSFENIHLLSCIGFISLFIELSILAIYETPVLWGRILVMITFTLILSISLFLFTSIMKITFNVSVNENLVPKENPKEINKEINVDAFDDF